jgi:hypothetical protein
MGFIPLSKGVRELLKDIQWMARQEGKERLFYYFLPFQSKLFF